MKRWNQKGSGYAKRRMSELRDAKAEHLKSELIDQWYRAHGIDKHADRYPYAWWSAAQAAGLKPGCGTKACIEFLRTSIASAAA